LLDPTACYRALRTRDRRFDGRFFVGVKTTGVYCRPICPARTPRFENVSFHPSAAAAQEAGFRPCLRCRPEASPDIALWRGTSNTVARALALIADGGLDGDGTNVDKLAARVGVGERQLRRLFRQHLGASPISVAQTRRVLFAKQLVHETTLPMIEVALASGFGSLRRFNTTFRSLYGRPPSELRRRHFDRPGVPGADGTECTTGVTLHLAYRPPYDWDAILAHLSARAIPGVEHVENGRYLRTVVENGEDGVVEVGHAPERHALAVTIRFPNVRALPAIVARVQRLFDLRTDIEAIGAELSRDPILAPLVERRPGLRVPGAWDGFELAVRAVLGQQVTVRTARDLARALVAACDARVTHASGERTNRRFPDPAALLAGDLGRLRMPGARKATLKALAEAAVREPRLFDPSASHDDFVERFLAIRGVGAWTAEYIALRALHDTDAFPATDAGLKRAAEGLGIARTSRRLVERAEAWRPWRAYAAQHLWTTDVAKQRDRAKVAHG